ncbi:ATP-binding protein [Wenzhouxiangella sp. XN24]|uniref:RNA-binding domain-containing protein n=1 Tax=Wenzhouxiangella sp. XN24 TaxID=2713569 RepID=UPI0013EBAE4E|nr:ATP-binding protein [Wenzhouxiangella sp. XN24]
MRIFSKRLSDVTPEDVATIVDTNYPEGETVEYKETLPARQGQDPWIGGGSTVSDYARNKILAEAVAFANAQGGTIILGIRESEDHPRRAVAITPIPRCAELAERIRLQIRDCIEPQLGATQVKEVSLDAQGNGVVVIEIEKSVGAPHRLVTTKECYIRRADRTERMTMREIQESVLLVSAATERFEERFRRVKERCAEHLSSWDQDLRRSSDDAVVPSVGRLIAVAVPVTSGLIVPDVHTSDGIVPAPRDVRLTIGQGQCDCHMFKPYVRRRPIVRGCSWISDSQPMRAAIEVHDNGAVAWIVQWQNRGQDEVLLFGAWTAAFAVNFLTQVQRVRESMGAPDAEYGMDYSLLFSEPPTLIRYGGRSVFNSAGEFENSVLHLPRYSCRDSDHFNQLLKDISRDVFAFAGCVSGDEAFQVVDPPWVSD